MGVRVGITMGDPAGIGPEVTRAALRTLGDEADWVIYAPPDLYPGVSATFCAPGSEDPVRGSIERSAQELACGEVDAVVTSPVSKACFRGDFPGHTELYGARLGAEHVAMMMAGSRLRVVPITTHIPLRTVCDALRPELLIETGRLVDRWLRDNLSMDAPRVAFAALNPHGEEDGRPGDEETRLFEPAVGLLRAEGIDASGPWPADTVFAQAVEDRFDVVLCGYHDLALAPFKLIHRHDGVNITLGLPRPRTSPDHGPAYDIAGLGRADPSSMVEAVRWAIRLAKNLADRQG